MQKLKKYKIIAVIFAVIVIPLVYSFFYLDAFWAPYDKLDQLPVAVVNQDNGAAINGENRNLGKEITDKLRDDKNLKWVITSDSEARDGLESKKYYATIYIPSDFSKDISTAGEKDKINGSIEYNVNEKRNYLASQVLSRIILEFKDNISQNISEEISAQLIDQVKGIPDSMEELNDGLNEINDGAGTLFDKTGELIDGQKAFNNGLSDLNSGLKNAASGSDTLAKGAAALGSGANQFSQGLLSGKDKLSALTNGSQAVSTGISAVNDNTKKLSAGANQLSQAAGDLDKGVNSLSQNSQAFSAGLNTYIASVDKATDATLNLAALITRYTAAHPESLNDPNIQAIVKTLQETQAVPDQVKKAGETLSASGKALSDGASQLAAGTSKLNTAIGSVSQGASQLASGTDKLNSSYAQINGGINALAGSINTAAEKSKELASGASAISSGANELASGISAASSGSQKLYDNSGKLYDGEVKLRDGIKQLKDGTSTANEGVSAAIADADKQMDAVNGLDKYISEPITVKETRVNSVPDYGSAFTPYFVSLSLWVGALMMFFAIYLDPDVKFRRLAKNSKGLLRFAGYTLIGIAQAVLLDIVILTALKLDVKNTGLFFLVSIVISLCFTSIMRFLLVQLKDVGKFCAILLLILQLTACGGTFPMELVPGFFNVINPFMPMTYSVNVLKEVISGIDYGFLWGNLAVLGGIAVVFFILNIICSKIRLGKLLADSKDDGDNDTGVSGNVYAEV